MGGGGWNPCFSRALNDWEVEEAKNFLERLHGRSVFEDVEDMVVWNKSKSGKFSTKSLYRTLEADCPILFPYSCIWNGWVQPKISFFAWEVAWGKALTLDLVQKRGWSLANRCFMLCPLQLERRFSAGMVLFWAKSAGRCGVLLLCIFFGQFGRRGID
ncbi:hypothetical protein CK203_045052 [Vitis vinifera]|uniref:Reverse transcriptase zinc-binding domain-containing protein n=1 Tax=Vitis vinifera TaxID=29760 RepID=A0A438HWU2_VITVI|nr:hypothetical protein CK203_045052 [Vitis vinifera]